MSHIIPPLLSDTPPPPPPDTDDHEEDEFGDFAGTNNLSYDYDDFSGLSPPGSPLQLPKSSFAEADEAKPPELFDINSNSKENLADVTQLDKQKDFLDKRKNTELKYEDVNIIVNNEAEVSKTPQSNADNLVFNSIHSICPVYPEKNEQQLNDVLINHQKNETNCDTIFLTNNETSESGFRGKSGVPTSNSHHTDITLETSSINSKNLDEFEELAASRPEVGHGDDFGEFAMSTCKIQKQDLSSVDVDGLLEEEKEKQTVSIHLSNVGDSSKIDQEKIILESENVDADTRSTPKYSNTESESYNSISEVSTLDDNLCSDSDSIGAVPVGAITEKTLGVEVITGSEKSEEAQLGETGEPDLNDDDFGDFTISNVETQTVIDNNLSSHKVDDFGDFASLSGKVDAEATPQVNSFADNNFGDFTSNNAQQEITFDNFASFSPSEVQTTSQSTFSDEDDDFGDFASTTTSDAFQLPATSENVPDRTLLLNEKQALEKSTVIVKEMFPKLEQTGQDVEVKALEVDDKIFDQIKNITDTHALAFQWNKSASQKLLLRALNIDSRNILYGHGWNPSMPRFAATLSFTPLEPVKSEILTPVPVKEVVHPSTASQPTTLDSLDLDLSLEGPSRTSEYASQHMLLDLEQLIAQLDVPNSKRKSSPHSLSSPNKEFDNWEAWLESIPNNKTCGVPENDLTPNSKTTTSLDISVKPEPTHLYSSYVEPLKPAKSDLEQKPSFVAPMSKQDDFNDFVSSVPPPDTTNIHVHSVVLRETHISNKEPGKPEDSDIVSWLEPTIVTPELTRKERQFVETEEDFEDFQMVVPQENVPESSIRLSVKPIENDTSQSTVNSINISNELTVGGSKSTSVSRNNEDDFGDFTFSLPPKRPLETPSLVAAPILQPLKPAVAVQNQAVSSAISWPDPGITDDEISRLEAYSRTQNKEEKPKQAVQKLDRKGSLTRSGHHSTASTPSKTPKQSSLDEDEWSDFVSVQKSSPVHKLKAEKERSSTPDLPLSVLNLGAIQPTRQPIPVITPNGLLQTKLSSNTPVTIPNVVPQANRVFSQPQVPVNPAYQPSIISNQFASQAYSGFGNHKNYQTTVPPPSSAEDDEWSDFVSHQPVAQKSLSNNWSAQPHHLSSWLNSSPNIITNPTANLDVYSSASGQGMSKKVSGPNRNSNSGVPSMSLPDLDFLAPRNRTTQRK